MDDELFEAPLEPVSGSAFSVGDREHMRPGLTDVEENHVGEGSRKDGLTDLHEKRASARHHLGGYVHWELAWICFDAIEKIRYRVLEAPRHPGIDSLVTLK